jgi:hypothetical protein
MVNKYGNHGFLCLPCLAFINHYYNSAAETYILYVPPIPQQILISVDQPYTGPAASCCGIIGTHSIPNSMNFVLIYQKIIVSKIYSRKSNLNIFSNIVFLVKSHLEELNKKAGTLRFWSAVRYSSSLLQQMMSSISPYVTQILVNGKQVTVGTIGHSYTLFDKPMTPAQIHNALYTKVQPFNTISAVLQQELIVYCGKLIAIKPELFEGILVVRIG